MAQVDVLLMVCTRGRTQQGRPVVAAQGSTLLRVTLDPKDFSPPRAAEIAVVADAKAALAALLQRLEGEVRSGRTEELDGARGADGLHRSQWRFGRGPGAGNRASASAQKRISVERHLPRARGGIRRPVRHGLRVTFNPNVSMPPPRASNLDKEHQLQPDAKAVPAGANSPGIEITWHVAPSLSSFRTST